MLLYFSNMVRVLLAALLISLQGTLCVAQEVELSFFYNKKEVEKVDSLVDVYIVIYDDKGKVVFRPEISGKKFQFPSLRGYDDKEGDFIIRYKSEYYGLLINFKNFDQDMKWKIGYDNSPYESKYLLEGQREDHGDDVQGVFYLAVNPKEFGRGIVSTMPIIKPKEFNESVKGIICPP